MFNLEPRTPVDEEPEQRESSREHLTNIYSEMINTIGLTGREIAKLSGTRPQYISDIKRRQRPLSQEMFTRTLHGLYGDYKWLIAGDFRVDTRRIISLYPFISNPDCDTLPLPVFKRPFMGPRMTVEDWDGTFICVASPVKERASKMRNPYILHLPFNDRMGRVRKGDYLLVDQTESSDADYVLIKSGWGVKLVRRVDGGFEDVESGEFNSGPEVQVIGNVAMLLMGAL